MKRKLYLLTVMLCLTMAMGISVQAQTRQHRTCKVVKDSQQLQHNQQAIASQKSMMGYFESKGYRLGKCQQNNPKRTNEITPTDSATVTLLYGLDGEDYTNVMVSSIMIFNLEQEYQWHPYMITPSGMTVRIPTGIYDLFAKTTYIAGGPSYGNNYMHIDEQVQIDKDTTIYLNLLDCENLISWDISNEKGELMDDSEMLMTSNTLYIFLEGYGYLSQVNLYHSYNTYINNLTNRYTISMASGMVDDCKQFYFNRLTPTCVDSEVFPLRNDANDYVEYEEQFQRTPKWIETSQNPDIGVAKLRIENYIENEHFNASNMEVGLYNYKPDQKVSVMYNAPKIGSNSNLLGLNHTATLSIEDGEEVYLQTVNHYDEFDNLIETRVDTVIAKYFTTGPQMMVRQDKTMEYLINGAAVATSEAGVWQEDYPGHPKFSYMAEQKQGILGNSCPLNVVQLRNLDQEGVVMINSTNQHWGRYGELIGCGDIYSTLEAKYNSEEVYHGNMSTLTTWALDSLFEAWTQQPRGEYELTFTNDNVLVDGIEGKNVTTICFDQTREDMNMPRLKMLQFRDAEDNVTDRFSTPDQGSILFAGGDFEVRTLYYTTDDGRQRQWSYNDCQPMNVEVSYAPYGTDEWQPLESIEHQSEFDDPYLFGSFYSGSLTSVNTPSENGWFDLKFRLVDESGNWQEQTLSPAFRIDALVQSAVTEVRDNDAHEVARYSIDGKRVDTSHRGVTIIRMNDGTARKVLVP